jgi:hypothetical protein
MKAVPAWSAKTNFHDWKSHGMFFACGNKMATKSPSAKRMRFTDIAFTLAEIRDGTYPVEDSHFYNLEGVSGHSFLIEEKEDSSLTVYVNFTLKLKSCLEGVASESIWEEIGWDLMNAIGEKNGAEEVSVSLLPDEKNSNEILVGIMFDGVVEWKNELVDQMISQLDTEVVKFDHSK